MVEERMHGQESVFDFDGAEGCVAANDEGWRVETGDRPRRNGLVFIGSENRCAMDHYFPCFRHAQLDGAEGGVGLYDGLPVGGRNGGAAEVDFEFAEATVEVSAFEIGGIDAAVNAAEGCVEAKDVAEKSA